MDESDSQESLSDAIAFLGRFQQDKPALLQRPGQNLRGTDSASSNDDVPPRVLAAASRSPAEQASARTPDAPTKISSPRSRPWVAYVEIPKPPPTFNRSRYKALKGSETVRKILHQEDGESDTFYTVLYADQHTELVSLLTKKMSGFSDDFRFFKRARNFGNCLYILALLPPPTLHPTFHYHFAPNFPLTFIILLR